MAAGMTMLIRRNRHYTSLAVLMLFLGFGAMACAEPKRSNQMNDKETRLWALIDGIHQYRPLHKEIAEQLTGTAFNEKSRNKHFVFLEGMPNLMARSPGQGIFSASEFSYRLSDPTDSSLSVHLDGRFPCVELETVRARYSAGELIAPPLPPPLTPGQPLIKDFTYMTTYWIQTSWGKIYFQFNSKMPRESGCLAEVSFEFKKP
jgi:hypothetical protein